MELELLMLGKTVPAVNWSSFGWIEKDVGLNTSVRTDDFRYYRGSKFFSHNYKPVNFVTCSGF